MASTVLQVRIDESLRNKTEEIFKRLGLNMSTAVRLFLNRVVVENGIPFPMNITEQEPNKEQITFDPVAFMDNYIKGNRKEKTENKWNVIEYLENLTDSELLK